MPDVIPPDPDWEDEAPSTGVIRHDGRVTPWHEHVVLGCAGLTLGFYGGSALISLLLGLFYADIVPHLPDLRWLVLTLSAGTVAGQFSYQTDVRINGARPLPEQPQLPAGEWRPVRGQPTVGALVRYAYPGARNGREGTVITGKTLEPNITLVHFQGEAHPTEVPLSKLEIME